jgi:hypothetical protein
MQFHLGQRFAGGKREVANDEIAFDRSGERLPDRDGREGNNEE